MGWKDLLQTSDETLVCPWVGGRAIRTTDRRWNLQGDTPADYGWYVFRVSGRVARCFGPADADPSMLGSHVAGYLVGDRLVADDAAATRSAGDLVRCAETVHLIEPGLDRFVRISAGRVHPRGPLVYIAPDMPLGCESDVLDAFLDRQPSTAHIRGVPPPLDAAFQIETWRRQQAERRQVELERQRREEQLRREQQARRAQIAEQLGDGAGRRLVAQHDFAEAATAALAIGGATFLDARPATRTGEMVVRFRLNQRRFECTCDERTLRIIDAGICLTDERTGERGDSYFTLESLPSVISEADRSGRLVVFRHVN